MVFFLKQKKAYKMSNRDWSSDECSSELQQCDERYRTYSGQETGFIPFVALGFHQPSARQKSSQKRYAEVDQHRLGDGPETDMDDASLKPEQRRQESKEELRINTEEQDLEDRVERDKPGNILVVTPGKPVPEDDHGK